MNHPRVDQRGTLPLVFVLVTAFLATAGAAQQGLPTPDNEGTDIGGAVGRRNLTRVYGTVYDTSGQPLPEIDIWVTNNVAPANRVRARTRGTGTFNVRGLDRIFTERDLGGVDLRLTFEGDGYHDFELVVGVARNAGERVDVMMLREGESPDFEAANCVLVGKITNAKGKGVKGATVEVSWEGGEPMTVETAKDGEYEFLLWQVPDNVHLEVSGGGGDPYSADVTLQPHDNAGIVARTVHDVTLQ